jgi:hypothetical protein
VSLCNIYNSPQSMVPLCLPYHSVSLLERRNVWPDGGNFAGDVASEYVGVRQLEDGIVLHHPVDGIDGYGAVLYEDLAGSWLVHVRLVNDQWLTLLLLDPRCLICHGSLVAL